MYYMHMHNKTADNIFLCPGYRTLLFCRTTGAGGMHPNRNCLWDSNRSVFYEVALGRN
eukprot:m.740308 g.740308  ORF g.740308 m.740308 type:complete len:58 (+) comp23113_c0_seq1:66-239(+)